MTNNENNLIGDVTAASDYGQHETYHVAIADALAALDRAADSIAAAIRVGGTETESKRCSDVYGHTTTKLTSEY